VSKIVTEHLFQIKAYPIENFPDLPLIIHRSFPAAAASYHTGISCFVSGGHGAEITTGQLAAAVTVICVCTKRIWKSKHLLQAGAAFGTLENLEHAPFTAKNLLLHPETVFQTRLMTE
jgi:hypothetical protein